MKNKSILILLIIVIVSGISIALFSLGFSSIPKSSTNTNKPQEALTQEIAKLIYIGTNETISEALYHLDLLDEKLDEPHIVLSILEHYQTGEIKKTLVKFIGKDNKVRKQLYLGDEGAFSTDFNYFLDYHYFTKNDIQSLVVTHYDINGNIIFKDDSFEGFDLSPDNTFMVSDDGGHGPAAIGISGKIRTLKSNGELLSTYNYRKELNGDKFVLESTKFSNNSKFFLLTFGIGGSDFSIYDHFFILFNKNGAEISKFRINNFRILPDEISISNDGELIFLVGKAENEQWLLKVLKNDGSLKWAKEVALSKDNNLLSIATREDITCINPQNPEEVTSFAKYSLLNLKTGEKLPKVYKMFFINNNCLVSQIFYSEPTKERFIVLLSHASQILFDKVIEGSLYDIYIDKLIIITVENKHYIYKLIK